MRPSFAAATVLTLTALAVPSALSGPGPAAAQTATAPGASADAYGVSVGVRLLAGNVPVNLPPTPRATQDFPPGGAPATASITQVGPQPADGSVVQSIGVLTQQASATGAPLATATSQAANVALLATAGVPTISATLLKAVSTTSCTAAPSAAGSQFVNLKVGPVAVPADPPPNTMIPLGLLTVIVNEQHPAADGRGLVVNALHVVSAGAASSLLQGDIIVGHALSTVSCPNGAGSTGASSPIVLSKTASPTTVHPGDKVTYSATITNKATTACLVNTFTDHLPQAFSFDSTSGALGTTATTVDRPGGGTDVIITPSPAVTIAAGKSVSQQFVVTTRANAAPGTYANDLELLCSDLGDFVKGLDAPVQVLATPAPPSSAAPAAPSAGPPAAAQLPMTGGPGPLLPAAGVGLLAAALAAGAARRRVRARRS
jgi:uncharacterized repeat protein (TIGR01451 family)